MSKKILVIEDEEYLADIYKLKFEKEGYHILIARDGYAGVKLAKKELPDLILLDLVLPGIDGYEVLAKLKGDVKTKNIKIFILSNLGQKDEIDKGLNEGADGYFIKANLTPSQLLIKIKQAFNGKKIEKEKNELLEEKEETLPLASQPKAKILLIEDEEAIINMYQLCFLKAGYEIEVARNGAWGLKLAGQKKFDVVIMDMVMPASSGYEAIKKLKADEKTKNIPIIILSNSAQDDDIEKAKKLGAAGVLLKTNITPSKLVKEVERVIRSGKLEVRNNK